MFCEKCGTKLPEDAGFCTNCGTSINGGNKPAEKIDDSIVELRVKPSFKFGYMVLPTLIFFSIIIVFMGLIIGVVDGSVGFIVSLISFLVLALILGIKTAINKKQYASYTYDFYRTKVIYRDSFLNLSEKEVKYKYIREVAMRQTFIQRFFNIGNIVLFTNAETGFGNGIYIMNVENVQSIYKNIKEVINV